MGVHPAGALPYFLPKIIGHAKAREILYSGEDIKAKEAYELGLINKIYPIVNFERQCIQSIVEIVDGNSDILRCTKSLLNYSINDLEDYIWLEECNFIRK